MMVLAARTLTGIFGQHLDSDRAAQLFLNVFVIVECFFRVSFALELKGTILRCLIVYRPKMKNLLVFAGSCYSACVLMTDVWGPWYIPDVKMLFRNTFIIVVTISGYMAVFNSLASLGNKLMSDAEAKIAKEQLIVSNQYYKELAEHIKKMRIHNHNMRYIVKAVGGLAEKRIWTVYSVSYSMWRKICRYRPRSGAGCRKSTQLSQAVLTPVKRKTLDFAVNLPCLTGQA